MQDISQLKRELSSLQDEREKVYNKFMDMATRDIPFEKAWDWYQKQPTIRRYNELERKIRNMEEYTLKPLDDTDWSDHMPIETFIRLCKIGPFFTDDDGFGYYATEDKQSNIKVYPSDIRSGNYRKDFTHIVWYNK